MCSSTSGWSWTPHTVGANRAAWTSPRSVCASTTVPVGRAVTMSSFHWTPTGGLRPACTSGRPVPPRRSSPSAAARAADRAGCGPTSPPSATATSWWPRQMPRVGVCRWAASRTSSLVGDRASMGLVVVGTHRPAQDEQHVVVARGRRAARHRRTGGVRRARSPPRRASPRPGRAGSRPGAGRRGHAVTISRAGRSRARPATPQHWRRWASASRRGATSCRRRSPSVRWAAPTA